MSATAAIVGGGMALGGIGNAFSASKANSAASRAADVQVGTSYLASQQLKEATAPYTAAGTEALAKFKNLAKSAPNAKAPTLKLPSMEKVIRQYENSPEVQNRLAEGIRAHDMSAAASGRLGGGGYQKELERYAQDYASNEISSIYNRLYQGALSKYGAKVDKYNARMSNWQNRMVPYQYLTTLGQNSALGTATQVGANTINAGNAIAQGAMNQQSVLGSAMSGLGNSALTYGMYSGLGLLGNGGGSVSPGTASTASLGTSGGGGGIIIPVNG
jgi:hypothetical protein